MTSGPSNPAFRARCAKFGAGDDHITRAAEITRAFLSATYHASSAVRAQEGGEQAGAYVYLSFARLLLKGIMVTGIVVDGRVTVSRPLLDANEAASRAYPSIFTERAPAPSSPKPHAGSQGGGGGGGNGNSAHKEKKSDGKGWCECNPDKPLPKGACAFHGDCKGTKIKQHTTAECKVLLNPSSAAAQRIAEKGIKMPHEEQTFAQANASRKRANPAASEGEQRTAEGQ
jgi:hypothetical protein